MKPNVAYSTGCLFRLGWGTFLFIAMLALIKHFVFDIMPISGPSMLPGYKDRDVIVLNKLGYLTATPKRGDSVVLRFPGDPDRQRYIKRIVGLPGETIRIEAGKVFINDTELLETYLAPGTHTSPSLAQELNAGEYFLMGDNRPVSNDSRAWGYATKQDFIGKVFAIIWPSNRVQPVASPVY